MAQPALHAHPVVTSLAAMPDEARPYLQSLLNVPGWAMGFLDRELHLRWGNDALVGLTGKPLSAGVGLPVSELLPWLSPALTPLCTRALAGESVHGAVVSGAPAPSGGVRHLRVSLLPAVAGGLLSGLTLVLQDETEQEREAELLRETEACLKTLVDLSCDGYLVHDGSVILEISRGGAALFGHAPQEMTGQALTRYLAPESRNAVVEALRHAVEAPFELVALRYGSQRLTLQVLAREVTYRGQPARLVALWDISGRKAAEEAEARTESLREQLLGVVGHDLRTPLATLRLGLTALQKDAALDGAQARQLTNMASATRRMERMVHELLDFTRVRLAGGIPVEPVPLSLEPVLEQAVEEQRLAHPERTVVRVTEGELKGHWDEARLAQLLDNLLCNALRHSPPGTPVELRAKGEPGGVTLAVHNEGSPLGLTEREAVFEPFHRGRKPGGDGLGLGLYIARQIAQAHGGRIHVESAERGTCFKVWLPRYASGAR